MEWISVEDRLPEIPENKQVESVTVLAYCGYRVLSRYFPKTKKWYDTTMQYYGEMKVTHWMPLPEPPQTTK